jgi:acetyl esterase/lipase
VTRTIRRVPDLRYGEVLGFRPLELDLYVPDGLEGPVPVVVYVHGGGWQRARGATRHRCWTRTSTTR